MGWHRTSGAVLFNESVSEAVKNKSVTDFVLLNGKFAVANCEVTFLTGSYNCFNF